jgi:hypothetical protein
MKKTFWLPLLCLVVAGSLNALAPGHFSLGLGIEGNGNSRKGGAFGQSLSLSYEVIENWEIGLSVGNSENFQGTNVLEPMANGRWYFLELAGNRLFTQADLGASLIFEDSKLNPSVMGGLTVGMRVPLKSFYAEPYTRFGYPFLWGAGIKAGYRF